MKSGNGVVKKKDFPQNFQAVPNVVFLSGEGRDTLQIS